MSHLFFLQIEKLFIKREEFSKCWRERAVKPEVLENGRSQNTVPIASTQVAIKGIVQYSTRAQFLVEQLATRHSREHTLSAVGPDAPVE